MFFKIEIAGEIEIVINYQLLEPLSRLLRCQRGIKHVLDHRDAGGATMTMGFHPVPGGRTRIIDVKETPPNTLLKSAYTSAYTVLRMKKGPQPICCNPLIFW